MPRPPCSELDTLSSARTGRAADEYPTLAANTMSGSSLMPTEPQEYANNVIGDATTKAEEIERGLCQC